MVSFFSQTQVIVNTTPSNSDPHFKCEVCLRVLDDEKSFEEHCNKHKGVSPLQCVECDKIFMFKCNLLKHVISHVSQWSLHGKNVI